MSLPKAYAVPFGILMPLGTIGNTLLLTVIVSNRKLRTVSNIHLVAIAIGGLAHSLVVLTFFTLLFSESLGPGACTYTFGCINIGFTSTILFTTTLAVDRWLFMFKPFRYENWVSGKRTIFVCVLIGIYSVCLMIIGAALSLDASDKLFETLQLHPAYNGTFDVESTKACVLRMFSSMEFITVLLYGNYLPCMCISVTLYGSILLLARKQARAISITAASFRKDQQPRLGAKQQRGIILMLSSVFLFALAWLPALVQLVIDTEGFQIHNMVDIITTEGRLRLYIAHITVANLQTSLNPWLIALMQKEFRKSIFSLFTSKAS